MSSARPIPGKNYTVILGDTLTGLAVKAYGNGIKWDKIWRANETVIRSGDPNVIYPGEILFIPEDAEKQSLLQAATKTNRFKSRDTHYMTLILDGLEVPVVSGTVDVSMDSITDEWSSDIMWTPKLDPELDKRVARNSFTNCEIYLGPNRVLTGRLYNTSPKKTLDGVIKGLNGNSKTADLVDSTVAPPNFISSGTMKQIANVITPALGIQTVFKDGPGLAIDYFEWKPTDSAGAVLMRLASQSAQLVNGDEWGNLVFEIPDINAPSVGTLEEGATWEAGGMTCSVTEWSGSFKGRGRYGTYTALGQSGMAEDVYAVAKDPQVPAIRRLTFVTEDLDKGGVIKGAAWRRSKQIAESMSISLPVAGWYNPAGSLWWPGQIFKLKSDTLEIPGFRTLVKRVTFSFQKDGCSATLSVVPPESLTGDTLKDAW